MTAKGTSGQLVSVVIVNWNGLEDTKVCLEHTTRQTYKNIEVIVVDNGSTDGSVSYLREHPGIKLVENKRNLGFTGGHIAGYEAASGDLILLLNNDAVMDKEYIKKAVSVMESDSKIGALGGRAFLWDEDNDLFDETNNYHSYQVINAVTGEGIFKQTDYGEPEEVNNVSGSCVMVRRSVVDEVGYLHDPFFAYYEEADLFARMKRAGYKVIYHPALQIWHANAKTSNKKAPTFFYYMMMRNRFRFAVRNFDTWALNRFLKFYLKMGLASLAKSLIPGGQRPMHYAYAKAFLYNLIFGWRAFLERKRLSARLGPSNYTEMIIKEHNPLSIVMSTRDMKTAGAVADLAGGLVPGYEIVATVKNKALANALKDMPRVRAILDKGYFDTEPENLAAVCSKNDWLVVSVNGKIPDIESLDRLAAYVYQLRKSGKLAAMVSADKVPARSPDKFLEADSAEYMLIHRSLFIDAGGLINDTVAPLRGLLLYAYLSSQLLLLKSDLGIGLAADQLSPGQSQQLGGRVHNRIREAALSHKTPSAMDKLIQRYYRLFQVRNLIVWIFSWRISPRLKLARVRNLLIAGLTLNRRKLALELKHIQNEVIKMKRFVDAEYQKRHEKKRLAFLSANPGETTVFIILRDRLQSLKQLLEWLEHSGLKKIVLVDNDSQLPPLVDFLNETNHQVIELGRNVGHTCIWKAGIIKILLPDDFYIVSDPDILPAAKNKDVIEHLYEVHAEFPDYQKVGLGLKIDDLPDKYPLKAEVLRWESQFWKHKAAEGVYEAGVDTTFALYKPFTYYYFLHPSLRTDEPYVARHTPWYTGKDEISDEEIFYRLRLDQSVNSWNKGHLPERYKHELAKQRH
jgi:GT2 family glycosyltransferase